MKIARISSLVCVALIVAGCQTASLEDAAPKTVPVAGPETVSADSEGTQQAAPTVTQRPNPGFMSVIPLESRPQVEDKEFVTTGTSRSGAFPTFETPRAANAQMTDAERIAAEAEMTELLQSRATTPNARAQYEARLKELRALADNHARETQAQIEN
ncbi:hypothetical protein [uncultured Hoeflea sp.]|uniref:hypothetical protein n=1 Tax=uncultured Hoeflea sp. TaxID=538666 RepID=UPI0026150331|nr:hypothetical protein [uncultured Hoeflea sp.]